MGISWGSTPQGSPLTNHPSWRRRPQVRLAAPAERWGGFGTCAQSGPQGDCRTQAVPGDSPAQRLSARTGPCPTCGQDARLGKGGPEPAKRATNPRAVLPQWDPSARKVPRSGPTSQPKERLNPSVSDRLPPELPGPQCDAAAARRIGAGGGRREYRECAGDPRDRSCTWTPRRGNHLSRHHSTRLRLDAPGLPVVSYRLGLETTTRP
jgi:hypothetical protein